MRMQNTSYQQGPCHTVAVILCPCSAPPCCLPTGSQLVPPTKTHRRLLVEQAATLRGEPWSGGTALCARGLRLKVFLSPSAKNVPNDRCMPNIAEHAASYSRSPSFFRKGKKWRSDLRLRAPGALHLPPYGMGTCRWKFADTADSPTQMTQGHRLKRETSHNS